MPKGAQYSGIFRAAADLEQGRASDEDVINSQPRPSPRRRANALKSAPGVDSGQFTAVGSQSVLAVDAKQVGAGRPFETYLTSCAGSTSRSSGTPFGLRDIASGYASEQEVWNAVRTKPGLAVVPRLDNWNFGVPPDFELSGFYFEEGFDPIPVEVLDKQTGNRTTLTVIGILKDTAPPEMVGISASDATLRAAFPGRIRPTIHYFGLDRQRIRARSASGRGWCRRRSCSSRRSSR